jgi:hypothetical protein
MQLCVLLVELRHAQHQVVVRLRQRGRCVGSHGRRTAQRHRDRRREGDGVLGSLERAGAPNPSRSMEKNARGRKLR